jgi:glycosyltransferase involved in cell wall biosynthesis
MEPTAARGGRAAPGRGTLLLVSQVYVPDPASVGQHLHGAAAEMARRGWRVVVLTSARGYDDPSRRYAAREVRDGVEIRRLPLSSFGKRSIPVRLVAQALFILQALACGLLVARVTRVLVSTSPPTAALAGVVLGALHRAGIKYWVMDLNPDQVVALGRMRPGSLPVRALDWLNRRVLGLARDVVVLDRYMAERACAKRDVHDKITVLPPWPHDEHLQPVASAANPFRARHGLEGRFVVAFSGNMSLASPLTTFLQAALRLRDHPRLTFLFVGGGLGRREVEEAVARERPPNLVLLPYQPLADLSFSLSAADVHVVTLGDGMVGIVHPCKVYGAMAVARPVLYVGPEPSHVADLLAEAGFGWRVANGDVDGTVALLRRLAELPAAELAARGEAGRRLVRERLSEAALRGALCDVLER